jgi:TPR repeat protein
MMATNIPELRRKADAGSCVAQSILGGCYLYGLDVEVDYKEAFRLLSAASNQGSSRAVLNLGRMYAQGLGIGVNVAEAIRLFEAVGKPENSTDAFAARIELGRIFARDVGVPVNKDLALKWYTAAIDLARDDENSEEMQEARAYIRRAAP